MCCEIVSYIGAVLEFVTKITFYDASVTAIAVSFILILLEDLILFKISLNYFFCWTHDWKSHMKYENRFLQVVSKKMSVLKHFKIVFINVTVYTHKR